MRPQDRISVYPAPGDSGAVELCPDHFNPYAGGIVRDDEACEWLRVRLGREQGACSRKAPLAGQRSFIVSIDEARNLGLWPTRLDRG